MLPCSANVLASLDMKRFASVDLIRWKMKEKFTTPLHGLNIYKHKVNQTYICEPFSLEGGAESRAWWKPGGFEEKWYLECFPSS